MTANSRSSQWAETTRIASGRLMSSGSALKDASSAAWRRRGSPVMYGQGPPPWLR